MQTSRERRARREQRRRLDEVEKRLLGPLNVVETDDERRLRLEQLPEPPGDLVGACERLGLPEQRADRRRGVRVVGPRVKLLHDLDHRPVGDALAVGEAAAAHDACVDLRQRLRDEPRLAHAWIAHHGHELAARAGTRPVPGGHELLQLGLAADEPGGVGPFGRFPNREERMSRDRLALALQLEQPLLADVDSGRDERESLGAEQHLARLRRLLEAGGDVDGVAGGEPLLAARQHLAGVDADPGAHAQLG